ncbi:MAG: SIMPL domain-containing protein [Gemmatimonadota bacterium]
MSPSALRSFGPSSFVAFAWHSVPALLLLGALFLGPGEALAQETTLQVSGTGEVEVSPDRARISFAVETQAETAREAGEANAVLMDRVITEVRATGLDGLRVETSGYQLLPQYRSGDDRVREIYSYIARNTLQIIVDDVDAVGGLVDTALGAGANRVASLSFELQDGEPHRMEALRRAVDQARAEAQVMASALGMRLGQPTSVQGGAQRAPRGPMVAFARAEMMTDAAATPVEAGLQTVTASVNVTYRLLPD